VVQLWMREQKVLKYTQTLFVEYAQAMGTHKQREKHEDIWIAHTELPLAPGHAFYQRLNGLLEADRSTSLSRAVAASWWNAPLPTAYETGGTRRMHLRGHRSILKRQLIQVGAFNLSLIPPKLMGPPRRGSGETAAAYCFCWHISYSHAGKAGNRLCRSRISMSRTKYLASSRSRVRCWPCRNAAT